MAPKLSLILLLPLLRDCSSARHDAHTLHYDFSISCNRQARCKVQGQLDENDFLSFDCGSNKVTSVNHLKAEVTATEFWREQIATLKDVGDLLKEQLPDIKPERNTDSGCRVVPPTPQALEVRMTCQRDAGGHTNGSWEFGFTGQRLLVFDSGNMEYTVVHCGGERIKKKWEPNQDLTKAFQMTSMGDCSKWLKDLPSWMKLVETRAPATTAPATAQSKAATITFIIWTLPVVLTCWIIIGVTG